MFEVARAVLPFKATPSPLALVQPWITQPAVQTLVVCGIHGSEFNGSVGLVRSIAALDLINTSVVVFVHPGLLAPLAHTKGNSWKRETSGGETTPTSRMHTERRK